MAGRADHNADKRGAWKKRLAGGHSAKEKQAEPRKGKQHRIGKKKVSKRIKVGRGRVGRAKREKPEGGVSIESKENKGGGGAVYGGLPRFLIESAGPGPEEVDPGKKK